MIRRHQRLRVHIAAYVASLMIPPTHPPLPVPALASGNQIDGGFYKRFFRSLLTLLWHFGSVLPNPPVAVRATIRNRRRSEQLGDDGAADLRQRWLRRWPVAAQLFSPAPPPSGAGVADRQRRCRSSARADADRSRSGLRNRRARAPA